VTASLVLCVLLLAAAIAFMLQARTERSRRMRAEQHAAHLDQLLSARGTSHREWLAVLGHELRSPVAAILGYGELLADGTFGSLDARAGDAVQRLRSAADQLLGLIDGIDSGGTWSEEAPPSTVDAGAIINAAADALRHEADARHVQLTVEDGDASFTTSPLAAERTLRLALGAAIKVSGGSRLRIFAERLPEPRIVIAGTRLDPIGDDPAHASQPPGRALTGAALRIALARDAARAHGGAVTLHEGEEGTRVLITVPARPIDSAEDTP
jgi:signal transduction histidine kinase